MTTAEDVERVRRVNGQGVVTLRWECRAWITQKGTFFGYSCGRTLTLTHDRDTYERRMCSARCPSCGATLTQRDDGCEVAP